MPTKKSRILTVSALLTEEKFKFQVVMGKKVKQPRILALLTKKAVILSGHEKKKKKKSGIPVPSIKGV